MKKMKRKEKNGVFSGHYVIASSLPPEQLHPNDDRWNAARSCQFTVYRNLFQIQKNACYLVDMDISCLICSCLPRLCNTVVIISDKCEALWTFSNFPFRYRNRIVVLTAADLLSGPPLENKGNEYLKSCSFFCR